MTAQQKLMALMTALHALRNLPGVHLIKLFSSSLTANKLELLSLENLFSHVQFR
jgi:hypothetical protein